MTYCVEQCVCSTADVPYPVAVSQGHTDLHMLFWQKPEMNTPYYH